MSQILLVLQAATGALCTLSLLLKIPQTTVIWVLKALLLSLAGFDHHLYRPIFSMKDL